MIGSTPKINILFFKLGSSDVAETGGSGAKTECLGKDTLQSRLQLSKKILCLKSFEIALSLSHRFVTTATL